MNTLSRSKSGSSRRGRSREPKRSFDDSDNSFESWESASSSDDDTYEPESNPQIAYKASTEYESDEGSASYVSDSEPPTPLSTDHSEYDSDSLPEDANIVSMDSMGSRSRGSDDDSEGSSMSGEEFADATSVPSEGSEDDEADEDSFGEFDTEDDRFKNTKSFADDESETDNGDEEEVKLGKTDDDLFWKRYGYSQNVGGTFGDDSKATGSVDAGDEETEASNRTGSAKSSEFDDGDTFKDELYTQAFPSIARMRTEDSREEIEDPERSFNNNQNGGGMLDKAKSWLQSNVEKLKDTYNNQRSESPRSNSWFDFSDVLKGNFKWYFLGVILIILIAIIAGTTSKKRKRNSTNPALKPTMPPTLFPTAMPTAMPTATATLPPGQVMESITFFSLVPNGKEIGVTEMDMEFNFIAIFNVLAPQVLFNTTDNSTNEDRISVDSLGLRGRRRGRTLKALSLKSTSINTTSIDCPELPSVNTSDLCFRTRADIAVMTNDGSIGFDYSKAMSDAINSGEIQTLSDEYNLNLTITILDVGDIVTAAPTTSPVCVDTEADCEFWAKQEPSQCVVNPTFMLVYCAKSCDSCVTNAPTAAPPTAAPTASPTISPTANTTIAQTSNPTTAPPTMTPTSSQPTTTPISCFDKNEGCAESMGGVCLFTKCEVWAKEGECENNPTYMWSNCAKSCDQCAVEPAPTHSPTLSDDDASATQAPTIAGCVDSNSECPSWASQNECTNNPTWMLENCKLSCNSCDSNVDPTCVDSNAECSGWASSGECTSNPVWMLANCQKSCNSCESENDDTTSDVTDDSTVDTDDNAEESPDPLCVDNDERCAEWAAADQCESNPNWMLVNCEQSCNVCEINNIEIDSTTDRDENSGTPECVDLNESCREASASGDCELTKCGFWASEGECDNNPSYMLENCSKSCGNCEALGV